MAKRMLADVLWEAANRHLRASHADVDGSSLYTCDCVAFASNCHRDTGHPVRFLVSLGLPKGADDMYDLFSAFQDGEERQGVRYMWLLLAMHVAEDEGIELEAA